MKVLFASSEIYPFAKTGGLADVSYSLPKAIKEFGVEVSTIMPYYKCVREKGLPVRETGVEVKINLAGEEYKFELLELKDSLNHYFLKNDRLYNRDFLYGTPSGDYPDNDLRFGGFSKAVVKLVEMGEVKAEIVHSNDWQTALIPVFIKKKGQKAKTLQTIHNLAYQGIFPPETLEKLGLGWEIFNMEALEFWGKVNFLKGGIVFSDAVNTVSPTYAKEITRPEFGFGLDGVLRKYSYKLFGILNGIDYEVWNPETDPSIYRNYSEATVEEGKGFNKEMFVRETGLKSKALPLFAFIGRFAKQKGVDLILDSLEEMSKLEANFAILGFGDEGYNRAFESIKGKYQNVWVEVAYNEELSRKMYASADFLLMPSLFEPCGLNQMIAMRYGTIVVARKTGGLADTVVDVNQPGGYGFLFEDFSAKDLLNAIKRAIELYYQKKEEMKRIRRRVMELDFSWNSSALKYIRLYENLIEGKV